MGHAGPLLSLLCRSLPKARQGSGSIT